MNEELGMKSIYLIKDLASLSGYSIYTIKYYLKLGLIKEASRSIETNFRYFDNRALNDLERIHSLRLKKMSLGEIKEILREEKGKVN